jgi:opacity protein-like surface antigen
MIPLSLREESMNIIGKNHGPGFAPDCWRVFRRKGIKEKTMTRQFATLSLIALGTLAAAQAYADEIAIKPKVIHSQVQTDAEGYRVGPLSQNLNGSSDDSATGLGFGVDFDFKLDDRARIGSEIAITNYEEDGSKASDMALGGFFAYDFISQSNMTVYGKGGISLHQFAFEDFNSASLLNGDLGAGVTFALADNMDLGGEYRYSTTLGKGDMSTEESDEIELQDVSIERNDLSVFLALKF